MNPWEDERLSLNTEKIRKGLGKGLLSKLHKIYKPSSRYDMVFKEKDITFFTNELRELHHLYIGKRKTNSDIVGEQYRRRIKKTHKGYH